MTIHTLCSQCGINVKVDEDGCCTTCGGDAMGEGVSEINRRISGAVERLEHLKRLRGSEVNAYDMLDEAVMVLEGKR